MDLAVHGSAAGDERLPVASVPGADEQGELHLAGTHAGIAGGAADDGAIQGRWPAQLQAA